jgi:isopentenyldiphosphate isomerase/intracellular septation protein A
MNAKELIKKMLPGLLPLFIFIIADELFETYISLLIAIGVGIFQAIWIFVKEKRFDYFVLLDTGLIVLLGVVSLISHNDLFFKLKPGIVEVIMCIMLVFMAFAPASFLTAMMGRYGMKVELNEDSIRMLRRNMRILSIVFLFHTLLVFYSAFYMSKEAWGFISGVLFYLIFGAYMLFELIKVRLSRMRFKHEEWLPIVDKDGKVLGKIPRSLAHKDKNIMHPVIHMHIFNKERQLYLQKRDSRKLVQPGKWDTAVGGHVAWGETVETSLKRETEEELGIIPEKIAFIGTYIWTSEIETELVYVFISQWDKEIYVNHDEVEEGRFWSKQEINVNLNNEIFTPNFVHELPKVTSFFNKKNKIFS